MNKNDNFLKLLVKRRELSILKGKNIKNSSSKIAQLDDIINNFNEFKEYEDFSNANDNKEKI